MAQGSTKLKVKKIEEALPEGGNIIGRVNIETMPAGLATEATLSTRATEATLASVRDRLPADLTQMHHLKISINEGDNQLHPVTVHEHISSNLAREDGGALTTMRDSIGQNLNLQVSTRASEDSLLTRASEATLGTVLKTTDLNIDLERDLQVDIKTMPPIIIPPPPAPEGMSTEATLQIFKYLASIITNPMWVEPITSRVKTDTSIVGGTLAGITNIATIGGGAAKDAIIDSLWTNSWANNVRSRIT